MAVQGIDDKSIIQICVIVDDVEKYMKKYSEVFGLPMPTEYHITAGHDETEAKYYGEPTEAKAKITSFYFGKVQFELLEPLGGPSVWQDFLDQNGPGVHHIAFKVNGSNEVAASFEASGFPVSQQGLFTGLPRGMYTYLNTDNALGTTVELLEWLDKDKTS
ncbi:VOC family protein [Aggregatilinea lenta]|uniref:VOC family protein n=1 Tax=Aggregatilinea lenta TaxID=913108 RepID=UPI000E5A8DDB|nr:VOC family protein [Aggregatilinea lenta]